MKAQGTAKRLSKNLLEIVVLLFVGPPELKGISHLRNEDVLDKSAGDEGTWRTAAMVDSGNQVGSVFAFGDDGIKVLLPFAVGLECEPKVFVAVHDLNRLPEESEALWNTRIAEIVEENHLGFGDGKIEAPKCGPLFDLGEEFPKEFVLGEVRLVALRSGRQSRDRCM